MSGRAPDLAEAVAAIHSEAFDTPWSATAFRDLLAQPGVWMDGEDDGFILVRTILDEAEILTLAVRPSGRRNGMGARLVRAAVHRARSMGAERLFLEVAEDNVAARALYAGCGFRTTGRRRGYYARPDGVGVDALLLVLNLDGRLPSA